MNDSLKLAGFARVLTDEENDMQSTTRFEPQLTQMREGVERPRSDPKLVERYEMLTKGNKVSWTGHHHILRLLGRGGQGDDVVMGYVG